MADNSLISLSAYVLENHKKYNYAPEYSIIWYIITIVMKERFRKNPISQKSPYLMRAARQFFQICCKQKG